MTEGAWPLKSGISAFAVARNMNPDDLRRADAISGCWARRKARRWWHVARSEINDRVAEMRNLPAGIDQRSASASDWTGRMTLR